ncbi:hypothetical protein [Cupriavidus numazuensis]|uniref:Uncharacterized protein n=1 Tax=Cupriavidus numazuensis TaxID=221992 RepID=A0ABM8T9V7_9BURK|nr:hypothetical protein [Cupriavidus numazuensis]CAG2129300.1 hypothetical protein LMG26411_00152 [Cupriavidus numazuensis]
MARRRVRYSFAELVEGFRLMNGSGNAELRVREWRVAMQVRAFLDARRKASPQRRTARPSFDPSIPDHKRRQANDLD